MRDNTKNVGGTRYANNGRRKKVIYFILIVTFFGVYQCKTKSYVQSSVDLNSSPVLSPAESIKKMQVEDGFEVKLVASEPLVSTPVAFVFDADNRMWVVEMPAFMPDTLGTDEESPTGKVVILEDKNKDGVYDERKVFLDSLILPRALCLIENGILVAEPPNLWYYEIINDKPGKKVLVDDKYTGEGNVEHYPNGLLRAMDNWIYNAKSAKRYRKKGDQWLIEQTHFRGQWGISQDNYGRLFYNDNSTNLNSDFFTPGLGSTNKNQKDVAGYTERTVRDNRVYPARPTPGVNRGYMEGILDDSLRLVNFTAACGPVVYRGDLFGPAYNFNAFVAEPSANLIKRNILTENGYITSGKQAYKGKEFLTSVDERFRPVNLYNGPDGALYVVDMYRGIIQHKTYLTPYLKKEIGKRDLSGPLECGRIYKIVPVKKKAKSVRFLDTSVELVSLLGHPNGWVRDKAQQLLVDGKDQKVIPALHDALKEGTNTLKVMHAMWTLEGLGALRTSEVLSLLKQQEWPLRMQALSVIPSVINNESYKGYISVFNDMILKGDALAAPYIAFLGHYIKPFDKIASADLLEKVIKRYPTNIYVADAAISNMENQEELFQKQMAHVFPDTAMAIHKRLKRVVASIESLRKYHDPEALAKEFPRGAAIFGSACQTCHGADGNGIKGLAPPLNKSEWVTGNKNKLVAIVLFGLTGPVTVNGHVYKAPEINVDMPGIGYSKEFSDKDVAELLSYIRRSWQNDGNEVTTEDVARIRQMFKGREKAFTATELEKTF